MDSGSVVGQPGLVCQELWVNLGFRGSGGVGEFYSIGAYKKAVVG